jgi:hypothetical protein
MGHVIIEKKKKSQNKSQRSPKKSLHVALTIELPFQVSKEERLADTYSKVARFCDREILEPDEQEIEKAVEKAKRELAAASGDGIAKPLTTEMNHESESDDDPKLTSILKWLYVLRHHDVFMRQYEGRL